MSGWWRLLLAVCEVTGEVFNPPQKPKTKLRKNLDEGESKATLAGR